MEFRLLRADEIDCRISICNEYGVGLLLYKDARCDQNILDETVGPMNWQRHHSRDNANCIVSLWDEEKKQWIQKEDTGKESFSEAEKGLASDSFKRACFNWGIGRELYTAPNMFIGKKDLYKHEEVKGKWICKDSFVVTDIRYEDKKITYVKVLNQKNNRVIEFGAVVKKDEKAKEMEEEKKVLEKQAADIAKMKIAPVKVQVMKKRCADDNVAEEKVLKHYNLSSFENMTEEQFRHCSDYWQRFKEL